MSLMKNPHSSNTAFDQRIVKRDRRSGSIGSVGAVGLTKSSNKKESSPRSSTSAKAVSKLVLSDPCSSKKAVKQQRASSTTNNSSLVRVMNSADREQVPALRPGSLVQAIEAFESDEGILLQGNLAAAHVSRGERGKIANIDSEGHAYISFPGIGQTLFVRCSQLKKLKVANPRQEITPATPADMRAFQALLEKQEAKLTKILTELTQERRKTSCWAWWVFPTDKEGNCDPDRTRITAATAELLLNNASTVGNWQNVLETICDLVEEKGKSVLPAIDHGRVHWFIKFWSDLESSPEWMTNVCSRLHKLKWPPR